MTTTETTSVRISSVSKASLQDIAKRENRSIQSVLDEAIDRFQRDKLIEDANLAFARLKEDPAEWAEELAERNMWAATLADGLEPEG